MVGFPVDTLPLEVLAKILQGGADKAAEAGVSIIGGHTIKDKEPKYGLSVTGIVHPQQVVANSGAKVGDRLFLTKPLGIGIITTGIKKKGLVSEATIAEAIRVMSTLNKAAAEAMIATGVNACTDITGFGFLGHLSELVKASGVGVRISVGKVPVIAEAWDLVRQGVAPGGTHRNLAYLEGQLVLSGKITKEQLLVLADAQTSGGLLISVPVAKTELLAQALHQAGVPIVAEVGEIIADGENKIWLEP
jgi:selenide,water dikinase